MESCAYCEDSDKPPVHRALVLSGGGGKGIYEAAWLKVLLEQDPLLDFDGFVGISAGSLNASYLAGTPMAFGFGSPQSRQALRERVADLLRLWESVRSFHGVYRGDLRNKLAVFFRVFVLNKPGAVDPTPIREMIDQHVRPEEIAASGRRLLVGATQLDTGKYVEFCEKCPAITEAVKGSTAIPAAFSPVWIDGLRYVDGAIRNNTPLSSAYRMKPGLEIVAVQTTPIHIAPKDEARLEADIPASNPEIDRNALDILARAARIMSEEVQKDDVEGAWRWHWALRNLQAAGQPLPSNKSPIPTRIWAPLKALIDDEKIFDWDDLQRMRHAGEHDALERPFLDFDRDGPQLGG